MDNLDKQIERIQKLMILSKSQNKYEAEVAYAKAQELIQRYNIDEATVHMIRRKCRRIRPLKEKN